MVKKVVAAAAAASGLVLAGAGLAVADSGKQAPVANVGSEAGTGKPSGYNPRCVDSSTHTNARLPHSSQSHTPQGPDKHHPGPGKGIEHPHAPHAPSTPKGPKDHNRSHLPHRPGHPQPHPSGHPGQQVAVHQGAPAPSKERPFPGELAKTGSSEELRLMLAGSTGLMLGGAILFRRTRGRKR